MNLPVHPFPLKGKLYFRKVDFPLSGNGCIIERLLVHSLTTLCMTVRGAARAAGALLCLRFTHTCCLSFRCHGTSLILSTCKFTSFGSMTISLATYSLSLRLTVDQSTCPSSPRRRCRSRLYITFNFPTLPSLRNTEKTPLKTPLLYPAFSLTSSDSASLLSRARLLPSKTQNVLHERVVTY